MSIIDVYLLHSRHFLILSIGQLHSHLIALSPKRIFSLSIYVKCFMDSLISGARILIFLALHSLISRVIRSISSSSDTMSAVMNSVG